MDPSKKKKQTQAREQDQPFATILLTKAHDPQDAQKIFTDKIQTRPLFLAPNSPPPADARQARRKAQQNKLAARKKQLKPKPLSASQRRKLGLYDLPKEARKYELFKPLHELWKGYVREILGNEIYTGGEGAAAKLCSADFHGAEVEVVRSGCVSRVGIKGIVVKDGKFAMEIVTRKNAVKLVPKEGTIFRVEVEVPVKPEEDRGKRTGKPDEMDEVMGGMEEEMAEAKRTTTTTTTGAEEKNHDPPPVNSMVFEIHGDQFRFRSTDRATRKFRAHFSKRL